MAIISVTCFMDTTTNLCGSIFFRFHSTVTNVKITLTFQHVYRTIVELVVATQCLVRDHIKHVLSEYISTETVPEYISTETVSKVEKRKNLVMRWLNVH